MVGGVQAETHLGQYNSNLITHITFNGTSGNHLFTDDKGYEVRTVGDTNSNPNVKMLGSASAYFDGTGDWVEVADSAGLDLPGDFTIMYWVNWTDNVNTRADLARFGNSGAMEGYVIGQTSVDTDNIYMSTGAGWDISAGKTFGALSRNVWRQKVITRSGNTFTAYVNGTQTDTWVNAGIPQASAANLSIMRMGDSYTKWGYMDEFAIWNTVIPIGLLYNMTYEVGQGSAPPAPVASFTTNKTGGQDPVDILITDTSTNRPMFWNLSINKTDWSGSTWINSSSSFGALGHTFTGIGIHNVTLYVQNTTISPSVSTYSKDILVNQTLAADFIGAPQTGFAPHDVSFVDMSIGSGLYSWSWVFGDGNTSTTQNPNYQYNSEGNFDVSLVIHGADGTATVTKPNYIHTNYNPFSNFTADNLVPIIYETVVTFTPEHPRSANRYDWTWGDGSFFNSTNSTETHIFLSTGPKTITLHAYWSDNTSATNTTSRIGYITPVLNNSYVKADFSGNPISGSVGVSVSFTDLSLFGNASSGKTYNWSFGDSGLSLTPFSDTVGSVSHVYANLGTYTVTLAVNNTLGSDAKTKTNYIIVSYNQNTQTTFYSPHQVAFQVVDSNRNPIANTPITANAIESTLPGGLSGALTTLENAFGVPRETALQMLNSTTQYSGNTDSLGYAVILMLSSIEYRVSVTDTTGTIQTITIMPQDSYYQISTYNSTVSNIFNEALSSSSIYTGKSVFNTSYSEPNSSYGTMTDYIYDATGNTGGANCWWKCIDNGTTWWENKTWPYGSGMKTFSMTVPIIPYQQWKWGCTTI